MGQMKDDFSKLSSEYLLQRRALGDELSDEAHAAIEEVFRERGEALPPRPQSPIIASDVQREGLGTSSPSPVGRLAAGLTLALVAGALGKTLAHSWVGIVATVAIAIYFIVEWQRKLALSPDQRQADDNRKKATDEGLTELMLSAAEGDSGRVRDLLNYGHKPNARSNSGSTALMYAVRNNHVEVVRLLLAAGADPGVKSHKGTDSHALAVRHAGDEIRALLAASVKSCR